MYCYIVICRPGSGLGDKIKGIYPNRSYAIVDDIVWAIGAHETTCVDVCETLEIQPSMEGLLSSASGVVVKVHEYYGAYDPALWQRLSQWGKM